MAIPKQRVVELRLDITGNVADQPMLQTKNGRTFGSAGIETGGRIILGTATTAKVLIKDANGKVLHDNASAVTASKTIDPVPTGVKGPLVVTVTEISNAAHTLAVTYGVQK